MEQSIPEGMKEVSESEFFDLLRRDSRDIMPTQRHQYFTPWECVRTGAVFGWCSVGWKNPFGTKRVYAVRNA